MTAPLRALPEHFDRGVVGSIDAQLERIEREHRCRILLAVESGSRAWGFASPDSDYDVRFIYVRQLDAYISPWTKRDVIETPLDAVLDVNGWDLGKALKLLLKGNAVVVEWLTSPIRYRGDPSFRDALIGFAQRHVNRTGLIRHYRHLGERQYRTYCLGPEVTLKKVFYALRPAIALRWVRHGPSRGLPPMHFPTLVVESDLPDAVVEFVDRMRELKARTHEMGTAPLPEAIREVIEGEFRRVATDAMTAPTAPPAEVIAEADALFRRAALSP